MFILKAFAEFDKFANNVAGNTATIGELGPKSITFSKEKGYYYSTDQKEIKLISFFSELNGVNTPVDDVTATKVFNVLNWMYAAILANQITASTITIAAGITADLIDQVEELVVGSIVNNGTYNAPEYLSWKISGEDVYITVWFADAAFIAQYDEYEITVIPPMNNLNSFFDSSLMVESKLNSLSISTLAENIQTAKAGYPETIVKIETFDYVDPADITNTLDTRWGILIYGPAGDNPDAIKEAISTFILANSTHLRAEWLPLLPDIFRRTEFIFTPMWDQYAIPNRVLEAGIYSPIALASTALTATKQIATEYGNNHIETYLSIMGHPFRSLAITVIGGEENRGGKYHLTDWYSDYISVNTGSADFARMDTETQIFANALAEMLYIAETMDKYSVITGYSKVIRGNILFVSKTFDNVQYLVAAKVNFN